LARNNETYDINTLIVIYIPDHEGEFEKNNPKHALTGLWFLSRKQPYLLRVPPHNAYDSGTSDILNFRWHFFFKIVDSANTLLIPARLSHLLWLIAEAHTTPSDRETI
jgi:hypothetical protein